MLNSKVPTDVRLLVLDPGHFHAALVQRKRLPGVSECVHAYAPRSSGLEEYLARIQSFNSRDQEPTNWETVVHASPDFLETMLREKPGNFVILAGNNRRKTEYLKACAESGLNVLSDKPVCIDEGGFSLLQAAMALAQQNRVLVSDMMTERFEITSILQRRIIQAPEVFGELEHGTPEMPAVRKESVHYLRKRVAGKDLIRPPWYFDVRQQGEGIVDVSTHLIDLVMWTCFPEQSVDYKKDVNLLEARRWFTPISLEQYRASTGWEQFPDYLKTDIGSDQCLHFYCNGEVSYRLRSVHVRITVMWRYEDPAGGGDTHFSTVLGTRARIVVRQGKEESFRPELYIEPGSQINREEWSRELKRLANSIGSDYPGVALIQGNSHWRIFIPDVHRAGHEAHFSQVTENFLESLRHGQLPVWEVPNMLAKYYATTTALKMAREETNAREN